MNEIKSYQVNYLLSISRLPDHFYAMVNGLSRHDATYQNPGVSLRSYLVAKCLDRETVQLTEHILLDARQCEAFSTSGEILAKITESLLTSAADLVTQITTLPVGTKKKFSGYVKTLHDYAQVAKMSFDAFIMTQDPSKNHVDITTLPGITLKEAMFSLQDMIDRISDELSKVPTDSPKEYA